MLSTLALFSLPLFSALVSAAPAPGWTPNRMAAGRARGLSSAIAGVLGDGATGEPTPISTADATNQFLRPALFAQAAYCSSESVLAWKCGPPCDSLGKDVEVLIAGGNDGTIPGCE